jgi:hypothetical protein
MMNLPYWQEPRAVRAQIAAARAAIRESLRVLRSASETPRPAPERLSETPPSFPPMRETAQRAAAEALLSERRGRLDDHERRRTALGAHEMRRLVDDVSRLTRFLAAHGRVD